MWRVVGMFLVSRLQGKNHGTALTQAWLSRDTSWTLSDFTKDDGEIDMDAREVQLYDSLQETKSVCVILIERKLLAA